MSLLYNLDLEALTGIPADIYIVGLAALVLVLIIVMIVRGVRTGKKIKKMSRAYEAFMEGKDGRTLEDTLISNRNQINELMAANEEARQKVQLVMDHLDHTYQKSGLVKYDAFNEMGGKLSFSLALLDRKNDGFIINAMHSREGCYTYIKEIIHGNSVILLSDEEKEALDMALQNTD